MNIQPITLTGTLVQLVPLERAHARDLTEVSPDPDIWKFMRYGYVDSEEKMLGFIESLLEGQRRGSDLPFAVIYRESQKAVGMTRYMDIQAHNRGLEIGGTWYGKDYQRTGVNTECKYLLLRHAFEDQRCIRVQLKADLRNERSLQAIERIGAMREGVLRDHMILPDGTVRSSVYYSILAREWPAVKDRLQGMMAKTYEGNQI